MSSPGTLRFAEVNSKPSAPPAGYNLIYVKTDDILYLQDSSGIETPLGSSAAITALTGEATASGPGSAVITLSNSAVIGKVLTGFTPGPNSPVLATDTILEAFEKLQAQVSGSVGTAITALTGDVSATGPGSVPATVNFVGGKTASDIASAVTTVDAATSGNTASTLVERDASGNFSANIITASLTGNVTGNLTGNVTGNVSGSSSSFTGSLSGDVTGTQSATHVVAIQSTTVNPTAPTDAQFLVYQTGITSYIPVSMSGDATITDTGAITLSATAVTGKLLTGYVTGTNTPITATNSILTAFENLQAQISGSSAITSLTGDVTATGPGSVASTVAKIQGTTITGTTGSGEVVFNNAPSFAGNVNMASYAINNLATPVNPNDAANKTYVDNLAVGIIPQGPIMDPNVVNDSLSTPPGSPLTGVSYIVGTSPTGAWATFGAGALVTWNGAIWTNALGSGAIYIGLKLGVNFSPSRGGTLGGNFTGEQNTIATVTNATPGSYAYTFVSPMYRWTTNIDNRYSYDSGDTYYYNSTNWVEIASGFTIIPGNALDQIANQLNVLYDNSTISINGSNQLYVLNNGIGTTQLANNSVTYAKIQNETPSTLLGNPGGSAVPPSEISLGTTLSFVGSALETNAFTGDITTPANSFVTTLATVNSNTGTFGSSTAIPSFTVNGKGLITAVTTDPVVAPAGTLTGTTLASNVVSSSLTSVGTITSGTWDGSTIAVAYGGTNNSTAYTAGSIIFSNGTALTQDNANFYWNDINQSIGIGTATPASNAFFDAVNTTAATKRLVLTGYGVGSTVGFRNRFARGTSGSPSAVQSGDTLGFISGQGYGASQFPAASTGSANFIAGETFTNTSNLTYFTVNTTPTGSVTSTENFRVASTGVTLGPQNGSTAIHQFNGGINYTARTVTASTFTIDTTTTDYFINTDSTSNAITITLPPATNGRVLTIEDKTGQASTNHITITPPGSVTINGVNASLTIGTNYTGYILISDGTNWTARFISPAVIPAQTIGASAIDWSTGTMFTKTLSANTTFTFSNQVSGQTIVIRLTNTASNYTVTWPTIRWQAATAPTMSVGAVSDVYTFIYDGSNTYGSYVQNMS